MFFAFKKRITDNISHAARFSIFLNIINIQHDACVNTLNVYKVRPCLATESTNSARMCTIVTEALQRQYSQTELIFWITLICDTYPDVNNNYEVTFVLEELSLNLGTKPVPKIHTYIRLKKKVQKVCEFKCHVPLSVRYRVSSLLC